jgi:site-specific recombinase XerD
MKYRFELKHKSKDGLCNLYLVVTHDKSRKYFNTNIIISENQFKNGKVVKHNLAVDYNLRLANIGNELSKYIASKSNLSIDEAIGLLTTNKLSFVEWMEQRKNKLGLTESTALKHTTVLNYIKQYDANLNFDDINYKWVTKFIEWLKVQKNKKYKDGPFLSNNYINSMLSILSSYSNLAKKEQLIEQNYFEDNRVEKTIKKPVWLTLDEIDMILKLDLSSRNKSVSEVRDSFVLCCYCGLRVDDLDKISIDDVKDGWLKVKPKKVQKKDIEVDLPLHKLFWGKPLEILREIKKPNAKSYTAYLLQEFADLCGIDKRITWHVARHSFAMNLLNLGLTLEAVQKLLGHSSITTTEIYARLRKDGLEKRIDDIFG